MSSPQASEDIGTCNLNAAHEYIVCNASVNYKQFILTGPEQWGKMKENQVAINPR